MTFPAAMRLGSLEIVAALALFGVIASRYRSGGASTSVREVDVCLLVRDPAGLGAAAREIGLKVAPGRPLVLGRARDAGVGLRDPEVSRRHAQLEAEGGVLYLSDCGSSNGTFLNGKRIGQEGIEVRAGDDIDVGNTRITITKTEPEVWT